MNENKKAKSKHDDLGEENDFEEAGAFDESKETTGRWTKEEHLTFIKGLELYGKGWKKIASLVKTRTDVKNTHAVVQIRTHAQKYFLKLAKARQTGESLSGNVVSSDAKSVGPNGRKRKLKRRFDRPINVAPCLQPYLRPFANLESLRSQDIDDGLYNFLSPNFVVAVPSEVGSMELRSLPTQPNLFSESSHSQVKLEGDDCGKGIQKLPRVVSAQLQPPQQQQQQTQAADSQAAEMEEPPVYRLLVHSSVSRPTEWYMKADSLSSLLKEAEELDWMEDHHRCLTEGFVDFMAAAVSDKFRDFEGAVDEDMDIKGLDSISPSAMDSIYNSSASPFTSTFKASAGPSEAAASNKRKTSHSAGASSVLIHSPFGRLGEEEDLGGLYF